MSKVKHINVIQATIITQAPFDAHDLSGAAAIQKRLTDDAAKLAGFVSVTTRMTKVPAVERSAPPEPAKDPLDIPTAMKRA